MSVPSPGNAQDTSPDFVSLQTNAFVWTDQSDYSPGATVQIYGQNFQPGEMVTLQVIHADGTTNGGADHDPWSLVAAADGTFDTGWRVCEDDCVGATLLLSAAGGSSRSLAQVLFTDGTGSPVAPSANLTIAWGAGNYGQLGNGFFYRTSPSGANSPVTVTSLPGARRVVSIAGGQWHTLALADDGTLWAWGDGSNGQLGNGAWADASVPVPVNALPGGRKAVAVAGGGWHSLAVADDGTMWAWGNGQGGQLGNSTSITATNRPVAVDALPGGRKAISIAAGYWNSLAVADDGTMWAWGFGYQMGNGTFTANWTPSRVNALPNGRKAVAIATGEATSLALADDGSMWAWGAANYGQLGNGTTSWSSVPVQVNALPGGRKATAISSGEYHNIALADDGTLWAWGNGANGQLGNGTFINKSLTPIAVNPLPDGRKAVAIACGWAHSLALADDSTIWGWGADNLGQLGDGTFRTSSPYGSSAPVQTAGLPSDKKTLSIASGWYHSFALLGDANQPPVARCQDVVVVANSGGVADASIDNGSYDPDTVDAITLTQMPAGPYPIGQTTVTLTVTDSHSAAASCTATVNVVDQAAPVPDLAMLPDILGQCSATIVSVPTATDNGAGKVTGTTTDPVTYAAQGTYTVTWHYNDGNGNRSSQTQTVIVRDRVAPVPDVPALPDIVGDCRVTITSAPTATDNCAGKVTGTTTDPLTYSGRGPHIVTWQYHDGNGNESTQTQTVIVNDTASPVPDVAVLPDLRGDCFVTIAGAPTATDNCAGKVAGTTTDPLTYTAQGTYTITWRYNDGNGNETLQAQTVIVRDTVAPVPDATTLPDITDQSSVTITAAPTATGHCCGCTLTGTTTDPLTYGTQGTYTVTWHFNDGSGNETTQTQTVIVSDTVPPVPDVASLPDVIGQCSATIAAAPTATDNCAGSLTATTSDPLIYSAQGTYTVTWHYNDGNGNGSTQTQRVIVRDTTPPVPDVAKLPDIIGQCSVTIAAAPTATDNCAGRIRGTTTDPVSYTAQGTYTVTWLYKDGHGNESTQTQNIILKDTTPPVPDVATLPDIIGQCSATIAAAPTATDSCAGKVVGTTTDPLAYASQGTYAVTWHYNDGNGNETTQMQTIIVKDTTPPVPDTAELPEITGECSAVIALAPTATDKCVGRVTGTTTDPLMYTSQGVYTVIWRYDDGHGNVSSQTQTVVVRDTTPPFISCPIDKAVTADPLVCTAIVRDIGPATVGDNCSGYTIAYKLAGATTGSGTDDASGTSFNLGDTTVTYTITDAVGLSASCSFTVTVLNPDPVVTLTGPASGALYPVNTSVNFSASFTDAGGGTHSGTWTFGDSAQTATITEPSGAQPGSATASYAFTAAGVYKVKLSIDDGCGGNGIADQIDGGEVLVVVYDPSAGYVTGGGWINSPAGAYAADQSLAGKATFGFVSKYQKGATVPTGNTEFQFRVASFDFHATAYDWLVVSGAKAQYKGTGVLKGTGNYGFLLTATDGQINGGGGIDKFRIKIWDVATGATVYDNVPSAADDLSNANPQAIAGGSIVLHSN